MIENLINNYLHTSRWCAHPKITELVTSCKILPALKQPRLLIDLPQSYSDLVKQAAALKCPRRTEDMAVIGENQAAMLCLVCGEMLCTNSFCCMKTLTLKDGGSVKLGGFCQHAQRYLKVRSDLWTIIRGS